MMMTLSRNPAAAYRKVELDARIEAASGGDLTQICLEELVGALSRVVLAGERAGSLSHTEARDPLMRAHSIALWLASSVDRANPIAASLLQFYGALATVIRRNITAPNLEEIMQARDDFADVLSAARSNRQ